MSNMKEFDIVHNDGVFNFTIQIDIDHPCYADISVYEDDFNGTVLNDIYLTNKYFGFDNENKDTGEILKTFVERLSSLIVGYASRYQTDNVTSMYDYFNDYDGFSPIFGEDNSIRIIDFSFDHWYLEDGLWVVEK